MHIHCVGSKIQGLGYFYKYCEKCIQEVEGEVVWGFGGLGIQGIEGFRVNFFLWG